MVTSILSKNDCTNVTDFSNIRPKVAEIQRQSIHISCMHTKKIKLITYIVLELRSKAVESFW